MSLSDFTDTIKIVAPIITIFMFFTGIKHFDELKKKIDISNFISIIISIGILVSALLVIISFCITLFFSAYQVFINKSYNIEDIAGLLSACGIICLVIFLIKRGRNVKQASAPGEEYMRRYMGKK
jgi:preprotein translocase subunit Sec61beta